MITIQFFLLFGHVNYIDLPRFDEIGLTCSLVLKIILTPYLRILNYMEICVCDVQGDVFAK